MVEISIGDYLKIAPEIIDKNDFQRKIVIKSKIKEILREDLLQGCSIPPVVLSIKNESLLQGINFEKFNLNQKNIVEQAFDEKSLIIIDGLQRTYVMISLMDELLKANKEEDLNAFFGRTIRAEVYVGLDRLGILYRMITLNTGQNTMSTRHLMEILYFDYQTKGVENIKFVLDRDDSPVRLNTTEFVFKDTLDGFTSYLEKSENITERTEILDNIRTLKNLDDLNKDVDLFRGFVLLYQKLLITLINKTDDWQFVSDDFDQTEFVIKSSPFGKSTIEVFKRSQSLTGFGAALGHFRKKIEFSEISHMIDNISTSENDFQYVMKQIIKYLDIIRDKSKKIGNDQRYFFRQIYQLLFDKSNDCYLLFDKAVETAFDVTRDDKLPNK